MNLVLQTFNETIEFLSGYGVKDHDNLTQFSDKAAALAFLHHVAVYLRDVSALRTLLVKEGNGINVSQLNDSQMLEVLAVRLCYGRIKVRRTPKLGATSAAGVSSEQQYMTPREVEQLEKKRRGERGLISPLTTSPIKTNEITSEVAKVAPLDESKFKGVEPDMLAKDIKDGIVRDGKYPTNELAFKLTENRVNANSQILELNSQKGIHGKRMYVIDKDGNLIIGKRDPSGEFRMPHPTLIGGKDPKVLAAGTIEFSKGKIISVDNASGHFKPKASTLNTVEKTLRNKLPSTSFSKKFKGFTPIEGSS